MFAPKQCLHQNEAMGMESPKMYSSSWCKNLTCAGLQTTPSQVSQYKAENGNLRKSRSTFSHGTVFAPKQCLYQQKVLVWRVQKCLPLVGAKTSLTCVGLQMTPSHLSQYRAEN